MKLEKLNSIGLDKILVFRKIYETKSIKGAASLLYLTPSAVSQTLAKLEDGIEFQLFIRSGRKLILTPKAKTFFDATEAFIEEMNQIFGEEGPEQLHGQIRIGAPFVFGNGILLDVIDRYRKLYPNVELNVSLSISQRIIEDLKNGMIDVGFINEIPDPSVRLGIVSDFLSREESILCGNPKRVPLKLRKKNYKLSDLMKIPHVSSHVGLERTRKWYLHHFKKIPNLPVCFSIDHAEGIRTVLLKGWGIGVLPKFYVQKELDAGKLIEIPGPKENLVNRIAIAQLGGRIPEFAQKKFVQIAKDYFDSRRA